MSTDIINVLIGIQARSTSTRLPNKAFELIDGKPLLQHVIDACKSAEKYMNRNVGSNRIMVSVALLVPYGDEIGRKFRSGVQLIEGPEDDVLMRYAMASDRIQPDFIVRITGDCPLIPPFLISKHIKIAVKNDYDYVSNVDPKVRTAADGMDCEVVSRRLLEFAAEHATDPDDRQHVTTFVRRSPPHWAKSAHVVGFLDQSNVKLSVDTAEDLERVREEYTRIKQMIQHAERVNGQRSVHRV